MADRLERRIFLLRSIIEKAPNAEMRAEAQSKLERALAEQAARSAPPTKPGLIQRGIDAVAGPARAAWQSANAAADRFLDTVSMGAYGQLSEAASRLPVVGEALAGKPGELALQREKWQTENPTASAIGTASGLVAGAAAGPAKAAQLTAEAVLQTLGRALPAGARAAAAGLPMTSRVASQGAANALANVPQALAESQGDPQAALDAAAMGGLFPFLASGLAPAANMTMAARQKLAARLPQAGRYVDFRESGYYEPDGQSVVDQARAAAASAGRGVADVVGDIPMAGGVLAPGGGGAAGRPLPALPGRAPQGGAGIPDYSRAGNTLLGAGDAASGTKKTAAIAYQTEADRVRMMEGDLSNLQEARGRNRQVLDALAPLPFPETGAVADLKALSAAQRWTAGDAPRADISEVRARTQALSDKSIEHLLGPNAEAQRALPVLGREAEFLPTLRDANRPPVPPRKAYELAASDLPEGLPPMYRGQEDGAGGLPPMKGVGSYVTQDGKTMLLPRADLQFPGRDDVALSLRPDVPQGSALLGFRPGPVESTGTRVGRTYGDVHTYADKDLRDAANVVDAAGNPTPEALAARAVKSTIKKRVYESAPEVELRQPLFDEQGNRYLGEPTGETTSLSKTQANFKNEKTAVEAQNRLIYNRPSGPKYSDAATAPGEIGGDIPRAMDVGDERKLIEFYARRANAGVPGATSDIGFGRLQGDPRTGSLVDLHDARLAKAAMNPANRGVVRENLNELSWMASIPFGRQIQASALPLSAGAQIGLNRLAEMPGALQGMSTTALVPPFLDIEAAYQAALERQRKDRRP